MSDIKLVYPPPTNIPISTEEVVLQLWLERYALKSGWFPIAQKHGIPYLLYVTDGKVYGMIKPGSFVGAEPFPGGGYSDKLLLTLTLYQFNTGRTYLGDICWSNPTDENGAVVTHYNTDLSHTEIQIVSGAFTEEKELQQKLQAVWKEKGLDTWAFHESLK